MFLDKYRGKGYVLIGTLTPDERKQVESLVSLEPEEKRKLGFEPGISNANIDDQRLFIAGPRGETIVAFRAVEPPPEPKPLPKARTMQFVSTRMVSIKPTKEQRAEDVERYKKQLEEAGVSYKAPPPPEVKYALPDPTQLRLLLTGQRKAVMVSERGADQARQWGLVTVKVPYGSFTGQLAENRAYIAYRPGEARNAKDVIQVLQKYPAGARGADFQKELDQATGQYGQAKSSVLIVLGTLAAVVLLAQIFRRAS